MPSCVDVKSYDTPHAVVRTGLLTELREWASDAPVLNGSNGSSLSRYSVVVRRGGPDPRSAPAADWRGGKRGASQRIRRASAWTRQLKIISRGRRRGATR